MEPQIMGNDDYSLAKRIENLEGYILVLLDETRLGNQLLERMIDMLLRLCKRADSTT
jgi:hypothetical protein